MEDGHFNLAFEESVPQGGGTSDFNELINRPKYNGALMTGNTNIPAAPTKTSDLTNDSDFVNQQALDALEQELQSEIAAEATARGNEDQTLQNNITTLSNAVSGHDADIQNLENDVDALQSDVETLEGEVNGIEDVIPAQASISNQLADKAFVNSTVQTSTANFRGNWANWASVPIDATEYPADYTGTTTPSTNDYMVVQDASGYVDPTTTLAGTWRFKYTGVWATDGRNGWQPEYQVNETPMTAAQLAALNSGATTALIEQITRNEDAISALDADKQDLLTAGNNITINADNEISADVPELLTTTGQSTTAGMTQKAITDAIDAIEDVNDYVIKGAGAPTTATVGTVGKLYEDTTNGALYQCTAVSGSTYTWEEVGGGGGGGVNVVQTTGTSTTDVMSQDAATKLVYPETNQKGIEIRLLADNISAGRTSKYGIGIGTNTATLMGAEAIGIGRNYNASGESAVAIGGGAAVSFDAARGVAVGRGAAISASARGAVAIGASSKATQQGEVNIGLPGASATVKTNYGHNGTEFRLLTGLYDGQNAHDAVNVGQINALIDAINAAMNTSIPHIGAGA